MADLNKLAPKGMSREAVLEEMKNLRAQDADWRSGRTWSLVYHASEEVSRLLADAYTMFMSENGLSPIAFPSLRRFEAEVVAIAANLLHAPEAAGTMTSGGSESILMAVKTARDYARVTRPHITSPELLIPVSVHPAFEKAAHYFDLTPVRVPVRADFRVDPEAIRSSITANTVMMVGSAPSYPQGVIDPIQALAEIALEYDLWFHVDACLGGFLLPWAERLGHPVPLFDFRVPGVTSMSADLHKYAFAAKGASVVLYRDRDLRRHQFFTFADWPGGLYGSPSMTGTRPGGAIAAAWAVLKYMGEEGYLEIARVILATSRRLMDGISSVPGLHVLGHPDMSVFAFTSDVFDIYALGDAMEARGWKLDRQQLPACLHMMVTPAHEGVVEPFLSDLRECASSLTAGETAPEGSAAMYGMLGSLPDRTMIDGFLLEFLDGLLEPPQED